MPLQNTTSQIEHLAREAGFDLCGVSGVGDFQELDAYPEWIAEGNAGEMRYLEARNDAGELKRAALRNAAPWAKSVVVCALNYNSAKQYSTESSDPERGWISRYAWSRRDYHDVVLEKLRALESRIAALAKEDGAEFRSWCYVDTGPLVERVYAKYAGVGWIGKNTCIINQQIGSWLFLGVILTSLPLTPSLPAPDRCGTCTRCLDACPTQAFTAPYQMDPRRCISYLTIEKRGPVPEDLREGIGRHVFGCDICQDVCPWNREAPVTADPELVPREQLVNPALEWLAGMGMEEFRDVFRGSPVKRVKWTGLRRNVVTAMGTSGRIEFIPRLQELARDEDVAVAEHARWALRKLQSERAANGDSKSNPGVEG